MNFSDARSVDRSLVCNVCVRIYLDAREGGYAPSGKITRQAGRQEVTPGEEEEEQVQHFVGMCDVRLTRFKIFRMKIICGNPFWENFNFQECLYIFLIIIQF